jgi:hypothetical protein
MTDPRILPRLRLGSRGGMVARRAKLVVARCTQHLRDHRGRGRASVGIGSKGAGANHGA